MSYLTFPRLHFSGTFRAYPSTINNIDENYDPSIYPNIEDVQLVWAPKGNGEFDIDCTVTMVEYADGSSACTPEEDPIIGQPLCAVPNPNFIPGALVDLDPDNQGVSELWGMRLQIGGNHAYIRGDYAPAAFNSMWRNVLGADAPRSSASFSAMYQSVLSNLQTEGLIGHSKFFNYFNDHPTAKLSINFIVEAHNNNPVIYSFNDTTFKSMGKAGVPQTVLGNIKQMKQLKQQDGSERGDVPTKDFVTFQLQQYLSKEEFQANVDSILKLTQVIPYQPPTPYDFSYGFICGTIGTNSAAIPDYFVPSRMMATYNNKKIVNKKPNPYFDLVNFAPFSVSKDGKTISVNLSNSLPVENPGTEFYKEKIGALQLVYFPKGKISIKNAVTIAAIPYMEKGFLKQRGGLFTTTANLDLSTTPLGIISTMPNKTQVILLAENKDGYYLRANQFVFRMNPGVETTPENPRGETATVEIHALKFGTPVDDGTQIFMNPNPPKSVLAISPADGIAKTVKGIAKFTLTASDPGNPRPYINGQVYGKNYGFADPAIASSYIQDPSDSISILVHNQQADDRDAFAILNKYGHLYKIMSFLTDEQTVEGAKMRNRIKQLLSEPYSSIKHMPVTRDLSIANRKKIIAWIDQLNQSVG